VLTGLVGTALPQRGELSLTIYSVADLRSPAALARIGRELDRDTDLAFARLGTSERARAPVTSVEHAFREWRPPPKRSVGGWTFFLSRPRAPRGSGQIDISRMDPERGRYEHYASVSYESSWFYDHPDRWEAFADLFRRLAETMPGFYGNAHFLAFYLQHRALMDRARGLRGPGWRLDREIPDVYWLNFFGPAYLERFGDRLSGLGVRQVPTAHGGLVVWATERPQVEVVQAITEYSYKRPFYEALGQDTFYHEGHTPNEPGERVPSFAEHREHAAG